MIWVICIDRVNVHRLYGLCDTEGWGNLAEHVLHCVCVCECV